jgi:hypothetical protein
MPPLTLAELDMFLITGAVALVGGVVRGFAGFGGGAIMLLVLTQFYDPTSVIARIVLIDLVANVRLLPTTLREVEWKTAATVTVASCLAIPLGLLILLAVDPLIMKRGIAAIVAVATVVLLAGRRFRASPTMPVLIGVGVLSGVVVGATFIALVFMIFIYALPAPAAVSRANGIFWGFVTTVAMVPLFMVSGQLVWDDFWRAGLVGLVFLGSAWFGAHRFRRTQEGRFRRIVLLLLLALSVVGMAT